MNAAVDALTLQQSLVAFGLGMTRVSGLIASSPLLGDGVVPNRVKAALCISLAVFFLPNYATGYPVVQAPSTVLIVLALGFEFFVGFCLGTLLRLVFLPLKIAGGYLGQEFGFSLGQVTDPTSGAPTNEMGIVFDAFAVAVFWITNADHYAWKMLGASIINVPAERQAFSGFAELYMQMFSFAQERGILLIAPIGAVMWLTLFALSVAMKVWPQITLFSFGMGVRLLVGFGTLLYFMPDIILGIDNAISSACFHIANSIY